MGTCRLNNLKRVWQQADTKILQFTQPQEAWKQTETKQHYRLDDDAH